VRRDALFEDPAPTTPQGQYLWQLFKDGKLEPGSSWGDRDFGQRICQIEQEAAEQMRQQRDAAVDAIRFTAIPALLVFAGRNSGVRVDIAKLRLATPTQEDAERGDEPYNTSGGHEDWSL
jgi:hypothetical protein